MEGSTRYFIRHAPFAQSLIQSLAQPLIHLLNRSFTHPTAHSLAQPLIHSPNLSFTNSAAQNHSLNLNLLTQSLTQSLAESLTYFSHVLNSSLIHSFARCLTFSCVQSVSYSLAESLTHTHAGSFRIGWVKPEGACILTLCSYCPQMPGWHGALRSGQGASEPVSGLPAQEVPADGHE
jgi:hypothetical protein